MEENKEDKLILSTWDISDMIEYVAPTTETSYLISIIFQRPHMLSNCGPKVGDNGPLNGQVQLKIWAFLCHNNTIQHNGTYGQLME